MYPTGECYTGLRNETVRYIAAWEVPFVEVEHKNSVRVDQTNRHTVYFILHSVHYYNRKGILARLIYFLSFCLHTYISYTCVFAHALTHALVHGS